MTDSGVVLGDERLEARNVLWAAGVQAPRFGGTLGVELDRSGRVLVEADCSIPAHPEAFVIGDMAQLVDASRGEPVPGVAQAALQMGAHVAGIIDSELRGLPRAPRPGFRYRDKGTIAAVGRLHAVADIRERTLGGVGAWLVWALVHILLLKGFRNRLFVVLSWIFSYLVNARGARLITGQTSLDLTRPRIAPPREAGASGAVAPGARLPGPREEYGHP